MLLPQYSSCCGRSSRIWNHGAFEPTKMCFVGCREGASRSDPYATWTRSDATTEKRSDPQIPHRVWLPSSSPQMSSVSAPLVIASCSRSIPPNGLNADPVPARQFEQWQLSAYENASATSYSTAPHSQRP